MPPSLAHSSFTCASSRAFSQPASSSPTIVANISGVLMPRSSIAHRSLFARFARRPASADFLAYPRPTRTKRVRDISLFISHHCFLKNKKQKGSETFDISDPSDCRPVPPPIHHHEASPEPRGAIVAAASGPSCAIGHSRAGNSIRSNANWLSGKTHRRRCAGRLETGLRRRIAGASAVRPFGNSQTSESRAQAQPVLQPRGRLMPAILQACLT